jgi:CHAD domain-containing protein
MSARTPTRVTVPLEFEDRSHRAAAAVLSGLLEVIEANLDGALGGSDPEALHDLRVSVRRSRSVQRELRRVFPSQEMRAFRRGFRWLQRATGQARDLDVQLGELASLRAVVPEALHADLDLLHERLVTTRQRAREEMACALRSKRAHTLLSDWRTFLDGLAESSGRKGSTASQPIGQLAGKRIRVVYRRMAKRGRRIGPGTPSERYHDLRKQGKELRYLLELFGTPLYPEETVAPMIKTLKGLQDVLGRHQDREAQIAALDDVSARGGEPAIDPQLIQLLVEHLVGDKLASRREFGPRFGRFAAPERDEIVRTVFR